MPILIYGVSELCFHFKHLNLFINLELYSVKLNYEEISREFIHDCTSKLGWANIPNLYRGLEILFRKISQHCYNIQNFLVLAATTHQCKCWTMNIQTRRTIYNIGSKKHAPCPMGENKLNSLLSCSCYLSTKYPVSATVVYEISFKNPCIIIVYWFISVEWCKSGKQRERVSKWCGVPTKLKCCPSRILLQFVATFFGTFMNVNGEASTETASFVVDELVVGIDSDIFGAVDMMHHQFAMLLLQSKNIYNEKSLATGEPKATDKGEPTATGYVLWFKVVEDSKEDWENLLRTYDWINDASVVNDGSLPQKNRVSSIDWFVQSVYSIELRKTFSIYIKLFTVRSVIFLNQFWIMCLIIFNQSCNVMWRLLELLP